MVQIIGLIIAVYCVARLIQVGIELPTTTAGRHFHYFVSAFALLALAVLTLMLLATSTTTTP